MRQHRAVTRRQSAPDCRGGAASRALNTTGAVTAQLQRDKVGVPKLSAEAAAVLEAVHAASTERPGESWVIAATRDRPAVARAWETGQRNPRSRRRSTGSRRRRSKGWVARRTLPRFCAMPPTAGSRCRGSSPGKSRHYASWRAASPRLGGGRGDHQLQRAHEQPSIAESNGSSAPGTGTDPASGGRFSDTTTRIDHVGRTTDEATQVVASASTHRRQGR